MWLKLPTRKSQKFLNCVQKCTGFGLSQGPANCGPQVKCSCCLSLWIQFHENTIKDFDHSHIVAAFKLQWKSWVIPTGTVWPVKLKTFAFDCLQKMLATPGVREVENWEKNYVLLFLCLGRESSYQCRRCRRQGFDPWVGKITSWRKWQPTPAFLPGEFKGRRSLVGCSPWGHGVTHD